MATARPYNNYLIAALVLKVTAISFAVPLLLFGSYGIVPLDFSKVGTLSIFALCTGLLFLVPNSWLSRSSRRVVGYLAATFLPIFIILAFFSKSIGMAVLGTGLYSLAPLSLMTYIKGMLVAKEHRVPDPGHGLWLMLGGGSGAVIIASIITSFTMLFLMRFEPVAPLLFPFYFMMVPFLGLIYLAATIIRAINRRSLRTSLFYTGYTVTLFAYGFCIICLPFWLHSARAN